MTKNEKCLLCIHLISAGEIINQGIRQPNRRCIHKSINLNNIIVKNCSSFRKSYEQFSELDEHSPEVIFTTSELN